MTVLHCAMCVRYNGESVSEVEDGETLKLDWQPASGWGLQEAHYTDENNQIVQIDLSTREFTMPDYDIVIEGTAKRFSVQDWTTNAPSQSGKVLGIDENGNLVPTEGTPTYEGTVGNVMQSDGNGGISANAKVNVTAKGDVTAKGNVNADYNVNADHDVTAEGDVTAKGNVTAEGYLRLKDTVSGDLYKVEVTNGALVVTPV